MTAYGIKHGGNVVVASQPSKRIGNADDMAGMMLFLASRASAHVTGAVIPLDGGQRLTINAHL